MHTRLFFFFTVLLIVGVSSNALSQSNAAASTFTLQVASFPGGEQADKFVIQLVRAGEHPICKTVGLQGRGNWTRALVGLFPTRVAALHYGDGLVARGIVREFFVRKAELNHEATRPRRVTRSNLRSKPGPTLSGTRERPQTSAEGSSSSREVGSIDSDPNVVPAEKTSLSAIETSEIEPAGTHLPFLAGPPFKVAPSVDTADIPRPDPINLALKLFAGASSPRRQTGLWLSGDTAEALSRLRWIVGDDNAYLISVDRDSRVQINKEGLARAAGLGASRVEDPVLAANYIASNEGLLLIVQLTQGSYRYQLHIGAQAPTYGRTIEISGGVNLDNNFDSRINPYRRHNRKLDTERPPDGFDALVGLNPAARWYNLSTRSWVSAGEITFHELAEAYAKLELGLDYLNQDTRPGAHWVALERERVLKAQRPDEDIVLTVGSNRVLRNEEEVRLFFADNPGGVSQR